MHTGEHRQGVILAGCGSDLVDGLDEKLWLDSARNLWQYRKLRVIIQWDQWQLEARGTTSNQCFGIYLGDLYFLVGQRSNDIGEELAGYRNLSGLIHHAGDADAGRNLIIEAGELKTIVIRGDQHRAKHGLSDLGRQAASNPRYGVGKVIFSNAK